MFSSGKGGAIVAGAIMIIVGLLFGAAALCDGVALIRVSGVKVLLCGQFTQTGILHWSKLGSGCGIELYVV